MKSFLISCIVHFLNISQEIIIVVVNINTLTIFILSFVRLEITTIININNTPSAYSILSGWTLFHKKTLPINPGIVKVQTKLKSRLGRAFLANSITLTPGTLTVETKGEYFYIHCIDVTSHDIEEATQKIVSTFEKYLEVIYG